MHLTFSELEIQRLFGHEAAENEDPSRLREYYFKTATFDQVITELPFRILVGHKGIGKSALFKVAMAEDEQASRIAVLIRPDDVIDIGGDTTNFLKAIRDWKEGLNAIVATKVFSRLGPDDDTTLAKFKRAGGRALDLLYETFRNHDVANLAPARRALVESFLASKQVSVYIDDLDRGWQGRREDVLRISALLNAVRDITTTNPEIRFRISLRSDVYYLVRTADESTDKIEGSVVWQSWNNHEIFVLLVKRIETFFGRHVDEGTLLKSRQRELSLYLDPVIEHNFSGRGHWENAPMYRVLMSLIRKRPRDLVKLLSLAAREARRDSSNLIRTEHLERIFEEYSQGRVQDTINEFRSELPEVERLILNMKPSRKEKTAGEGYIYATDRLLNKINNIIQLGRFQMANGRIAGARDLAAFLYKINFLTARKEVDGKLIRKYFEDNRYLSGTFADFGFDWEIHPAYRWALQPEDIRSIYQSLRLSESE